MNSLQIIQQLIDNKKFAEAIGMLTEQINDTVAGGDCNDKAELYFFAASCCGASVSIAER